MLVVFYDIALVLVGRTSIPFPFGYFITTAATGNGFCSIQMICNVIYAKVVRPLAGLGRGYLLTNLYRAGAYLALNIGIGIGSTIA